MIRKNWLKNLLATLFWVAAWYILALWMENPLLLPTPGRVLCRCLELMGTAAFWRTAAASIGRIMVGVVCAVALGVALAIACAASTLADALIAPVMRAVQAAPVASFSILLLIWLERDLVPVLICVMMVAPVVWSNVCTGIRQTDRGLLEMARVYRLSRGRILTRIYVPSVLPYFQAACSGALGLGWKAGIAAEVLTVPAMSIGRMISESKLYLLTEDLFAWTLTVVLLSLLLQKIAMHLLKRGERRA